MKHVLTFRAALFLDFCQWNEHVYLTTDLWVEYLRAVHKTEQSGSFLQFVQEMILYYI